MLTESNHTETKVSLSGPGFSPLLRSSSLIQCDAHIQTSSTHSTSAYGEKHDEAGVGIRPSSDTASSMPHDTDYNNNRNCSKKQSNCNHKTNYHNREYHQDNIGIMSLTAQFSGPGFSPLLPSPSHTHIHDRINTSHTQAHGENDDAVDGSADMLMNRANGGSTVTNRNDNNYTDLNTNNNITNNNHTRTSNNHIINIKNNDHTSNSHANDSNVSHATDNNANDSNVSHTTDNNNINDSNSNVSHISSDNNANQSWNNNDNNSELITFNHVMECPILKSVRAHRHRYDFNSSDSDNDDIHKDAKSIVTRETNSVSLRSDAHTNTHRRRLRTHKERHTHDKYICNRNNKNKNKNDDNSGGTLVKAMNDLIM